MMKFYHVMRLYLQVGKEHRYLQKLIDLLPYVKCAGDKVPIKGGFDMSCLLPGMHVQISLPFT